MDKDMGDTLLTKNDVRTRRGWSNWMIKKFLVQPDSIKKRKSYGTCAMYSLLRVEQAEKDPKFIEAVEQSIRRSEKSWSK